MARSKYLPKNETRSLEQVARDAGMAVDALRSRLRRGIPFAKAVAEGSFSSSTLTTLALYTWKGQKRSLGEICRMEGLNFATVTSRIKRGMSFKKAVTSPVRKYRGGSKDRKDVGDIMAMSGFTAYNVRRHLTDYALTPYDIIQLGTCNIKHFLPEGYTLKTFAKHVGKAPERVEHLLRAKGVPAEELLA